MANWVFDENDVMDNDFAPIPEGNHRVRILSTEEKVSSTHKQMIEFTLEVSGYAGRLWDYLVLDNSNDTARKRTNTKINQIAQSFGVKPQTVVTNHNSLVGKVGGVRVKHNPYNGETRANVSYYLNADKVNALPAWKNADGSTNYDNLDIDVIDDDVNF